MKPELIVNKPYFSQLIDQFEKLISIKNLILVALFVCTITTVICLANDWILLYGDAESHINIAKRVVGSITPGMAQLGGIWLPLPHLMMLPLVMFDPLWRSGLAGSIVGGIMFIISSIYLYKLTYLITQNKWASLISFIVFITNPNILYLQSTPLTEIPLISFIILSSYYFIQFMKTESVLALILAALWGFCATLSRYDGWFLVLTEAGLLCLKYLLARKRFRELEGLLLMFCTLAFVGIFIWFAWDWLILGDPMYFTSSPFSAKSQQQNWLARGQLPAYHNLPLSFIYYFTDSMNNIGVILFSLSITGLIFFTKNNLRKNLILAVFLLLSPFVFNILTLFLGQSVIFLPSLTPDNFDWRLFNARYGSLMISTAAFFIGYLFYQTKNSGKLLIFCLIFLQLGFFLTGYSKVISWEDGKTGLSSAKRPDAERWLAKNYDTGLVLMDDFSRATSIIRSGIPMQNTIYIGNKPYWEESLKQPEKYADWIIIQKEDDIWKNILSKPEMSDRLYAYFNKVYTSPDIQIFHKINHLKTN